jgi:hypothetical protein
VSGQRWARRKAVARRAAGLVREIIWQRERTEREVRQRLRRCSRGGPARFPFRRLVRRPCRARGRTWAGCLGSCLCRFGTRLYGEGGRGLEGVSGGLAGRAVRRGKSPILVLFGPPAAGDAKSNRDTGKRETGCDTQNRPGMPSRGAWRASLVEPRGATFVPCAAFFVRGHALR